MDVWLHFYKIQEQAELNYGDRDQNSVYLWGIPTRKRSKGTFWGAGNVLYFDLEGDCPDEYTHVRRTRQTVL